MNIRQMILMLMWLEFHPTPRFIWEFFPDFIFYELERKKSWLPDESRRSLGTLSPDQFQGFSWNPTWLMS